MPDGVVGSGSPRRSRLPRFATTKHLLMWGGQVLGGVIFAGQVWRGWLALRQEDYMALRTPYLFASVATVLVLLAVQMLAWRLLMRLAGVRLTVRDVVAGYFLSFLPRYIPGTVWGYLGRSRWLARYHGVDYRISGLVSFIEGGAFCLTSLVVGTAYLSVRTSGWAQVALGGSAFAFSLLALVALPGLLVKLSTRFQEVSGSDVDSGSSSAACQVTRQKLDATPLVNNAVSVREVAKLWLGGWWLYVAFWAIFGLAAYLVHRAIGSPGAPLLDYREAVWSVSVSWLVGFVAVVIPTGIGVREWSLAFLLTDYCGVGASQATVIAILLRFELIIAELIWLCIALAMRVSGSRDKSGADET